MKKLIYTIIIALILSFLIGCKAKTIYVPVESVKTEKEYIDKWHRDSIFLYKNKYVYTKGDTVFIIDSVIHYRDKYIRDSIFKTDSIYIDKPYPVVEIKEVNRLENWQILLMVLGGVFVGFLGFRLYRWIKK